MSSFDGKVVLITGAAAGIGAATAKLFAARGAKVVVFYIDENGGRAAVQEIAADGGSADLYTGDVTDPAVCSAAVRRAVERFGRLDVLVNNGTITVAQWDDLLGTNLRAPLLLSQAAAPALRAARGLIINIADIHGQRPLRHHTTYSIAKAGLVMLTRSFARELAPEVRVNAIAPGPVMWPVSGADEALKAEIVERTALKRLGSQRDVALAARYFAVDAPFVTGQILAVDGGRSTAW